jgi:hypothetical protein
MDHHKANHYDHHPPTEPLPPPSAVSAPPQPVYVPPAVGQPYPPYQLPAENPGQVTGIIGIVLAFIGIVPIGLILSIISTVQSSKARASKVLGIVGIVLNGIGLLLLVAAIILFAFATKYGIEEEAKSSRVRANAHSLEKKAEAFYVINGYYPQSIQDFSKHSETKLDEIDITIDSVQPIDDTSIMYEACGKNGAEIVYYDFTNSSYDSEFDTKTLYLGDGVSSCASSSYVE